MNIQHLSDEQRGIISKVEKLLRLAGGTTNEEEASSATSKAMELLAAYNLDVSAIGSGESDSGKRQQEKLQGGFYEYERDLMTRIADLNFCLCWSQLTWIERPKAHLNLAHVKRIGEERGRWRMEHMKVRQYRIVGRAVNVVSTKVMYDYLLQAIERLTREFISPGLLTENDRIVGLSAALRSRRATSFREGVAARVASKLWDRREEQLTAERDEAERLRAAAEKAASDRPSVGTALTLSSLRQSERDANMDALYGEGWSAKQRLAREEQARKAREAEEAYTRWAAANPEEARKQEAERRKEEEKERKRWSRGGPGSRGGLGKQRDESAFSAGYKAGERVSIDQQAETRKSAGVLR